MQIAEPVWIAAAVAAIALVAVLAWIDARRRRRAVERFASPVLAEALTGAVARRRRALKASLFALGAALAALALARPQWGGRWEQTERQGTDILFAIDTSRSMLAEDLRPSRLERAKLAVADLVEQFDGDRAGLVAFAGAAFLQSPMTIDRVAFQRALDALDTSIIPRGGTDVAAAIRESIAALGESEHEKILVLLTDGESLEGDLEAAAEEARAAGVRVFAVGLGGEDGAPIPVRDERGQQVLLRDPTTGELVRSRLDERALRRIADATGGAYERLGESGAGLTRLWRDHLSSLPSHAVATRRHRVMTERFQWPLGLALALLLIEPWIGERRRAQRARRSRAPVALAAAAGALLLPAIAAADAGDGEQAYRAGDYARAQRAYAAAAERDPSDERLELNAGAAAYRTGDHEAAIEALDRALRSDDVRLQRDAYYDRGNAQFRLGERTLETDRDATARSWRAAIASYESALALDAGDADARYNLELARRRLAELEREDAQQPEPPPSDGDPQQQSGSESGEQQESGSQSGEQQQSGSESGEQQESGSESGEQQESGAQSGEQQQDGEKQRPSGTQAGERQHGAHPQQGADPQPGADRQESGPTPQGDAPAPGAQPGDRPPPDPSAFGAAPTNDPGEPSDTSVTSAGRLSRDDAEQLLRSLRHEERRFPLAARARGAADDRPTTFRDW